jgi:predicted DsbA family dithiol-disulfide isomerase
MVPAPGRWADSSPMADVRITEFTDPGCPWAWSAEPFRRRLNWLYADSVEWEVRLVVLAESPSEYEERGFDTEKQAASFRKISREHGMPIDTRERPRMAATMPACRAVVAARRRDPERMRELLRRLRVRHFAGELLDEQSTLVHAARDAGIDPDQLDDWMAEPNTETELREDMALARGPMPAAHVLDHKLANWSGGRRYTCPSYEIVRMDDGVRIAVPGFQPFGVYDVITANLVPASDRREDPDSVEQVLDWCDTPLATQEVAVVCSISHDEAREQLGRVAGEEHMGYDGFWTLNGSA